MIRLFTTLLLLTAPVQAMRAESLPPPSLPGGPIQKFFSPRTRVDGMPIYQEEWRVWDGHGRVWVPMMSERGVEILFGIKPGPPTEDVLPAPPIPKRQRRLE